MKARLAWLVLVTAAMSLAPAASAQIVQEREPWRPPALEPSPTCEVWSGTGSGNDKTLLVEVRICEKDSKISGQSQHSGKASGWSVRKLEGEWQAGRSRLVMKETEITENRPNDGWRFCTVDTYTMALASEREMSGTYDSAACHDHGTLSLKLTRSYQDARPDPRPKMQAGPPTVIPPSKPPSRSSCACDAAGAPSCAGPWRLALVATLCFRRRRR